MKWITALWGLILLTQFSIAAPVIHRAFEPARASLDISLKKQSFTLYLSLDSEAVKVLAQGEPGSQIVESLSETPELFIPDSSAQCTLEASQFMAETAEASGLSSAGQEVNGYMAFLCEKPAELDTIKVMLENALPGLREISVWVVTDNWQSKQVLRKGDQLVKMRE
ncbi:MAG: hypothetical protein ACR2PT_23205 [Endozoicomonas sp.]